MQLLQSQLVAVTCHLDIPLTQRPFIYLYLQLHKTSDEPAIQRPTTTYTMRYSLASDMHYSKLLKFFHNELVRLQATVTMTLKSYINCYLYIQCPYHSTYSTLIVISTFSGPTTVHTVH